LFSIRRYKFFVYGERVFLIQTQLIGHYLATSTFSMFVITLFSTTLYAMQTKKSIPEPSIEYYYLPFTIPLIFAVMPGGYLGAKLKNKLHAENLKRTLSLLQIII